MDSQKELERETWAHQQNQLPPVKLEINKSRGIKPVKHFKAYDIPIHLREAAQAEFTEMRKAGIIVESDGEASEWSSLAFPRRKPNSWPIKCRWVTDFRDLNKALNCPIWGGGESSAQLLRQIDPSARFFAVFDAISGFHQVAVNTESSKLLNITTQMGNFRYTVLGQGLCCSQDLFNFITSGSTQTDTLSIYLKMWMIFAYFQTQLKGSKTKLIS